MRTATTLAAFVFLAAGTSAAQADDKCPPLQQVNTVQMTRVTDGGTDRDTVPFIIGGVQENFLFDTGAISTAINPAVADALKLAVHPVNHGIMDASGHKSSDVAVVPHFSFGLLHGDNVQFMLSPTDGMLTRIKGDGLYGIDYMGAYDTDVDFGTDTLNLFSPDHCPGAVVYWKAAAVGVVPMTVGGGHISIPVTLDGQRVFAIMDTGAPKTVMATSLAKFESQFGVTPGSPDMPIAPPEPGAAASQIPTYLHTFKTLTFGDVTVTNATIRISPELVGTVNANPFTFVILGMDVLRKLHLYMAFKEKMMYVSPASAPTPAQTPAATPAP